jgi:EmrB/QacA subfamily drug resistance transporter
VTARAGRGAAVLVMLAVAELMLTVDLSITNVAVPAIRTDLGFSASGLEWVVNGYALTFGGLLLLGGRAADVLGERRVFCAALGLFVLASLACGLAASPGMLVAGRLVQGAAAGVLSPTTLSILTSTYRQGDERNQVMSIWTGVAIGGGAVGAVLGGVLVAALSWRWIFFVNLPVGIALLAAATRRLPSGSATGSRLDVAGAVTATLGLTALVWSLSRAQTSGWSGGYVVAGLVVAVALLAAFGLLETRVRSPLVPFAVFRSRLLTAGNLLSFLSFVPVLAVWYFLTLYLQARRGFSAWQAGLIFVPLTVAVAAGSSASFRLIGRFDARALFALGGVLAAVGAAWLSRLTPSGNLTLTVVVPAALVMLGGGLMFAPITVAATSDIPPERSGLASGLLNTTRQIGGAIGLAVLATVAAAPGRPGPAGSTDGYSAAFAMGAATFLVTAILGVLLLPQRFPAPHPDEPSEAAAQSEQPGTRPPVTRRRALDATPVVDYRNVGPDSCKLESFDNSATYRYGSPRMSRAVAVAVPRRTHRAASRRHAG